MEYIKITWPHNSFYNFIKFNEEETQIGIKSFNKIKIIINKIYLNYGSFKLDLSIPCILIFV